MHYPELNTLSDVLFLDGEEWRDIKSHEGNYQVSSFGRVKCVYREVTMRNQCTSWTKSVEPRIMKVHPDSKGYPQVLLSVGGRRVARVHRLVAETFLESPSEELVINSGKHVFVNHKDCNILNPNISNLEWCTPAYNNSYLESSLKYVAQRGSLGEHAVLSEVDVDKILEMLRDGRTQQSIADEFKVKQITISNIATGRSWAWYTGKEKKARSVKKTTNLPLSESNTRS